MSFSLYFLYFLFDLLLYIFFDSGEFLGLFILVFLILYAVVATQNYNFACGSVWV
jgi:hypothetical protein